MQDLRIAITTLGDGYPGTGLDKWLATEHVLGSHMARIVMEGGPPVDVSVDQQFQRIKPFLDWGSALSRNLRHLRNIGCTPEGIREVHGYAWSALTSQYERFGKGAPPEDFAPR